ncbi:GM10387 [Drosophila sechellia]|uniref:GM10387 n=1 Tax=Drosophila sechellia TaxID=7238 RepID=B4IC84_DROSE|nr:GM10387 [Drosophila sechellia]
MQKRPKAEMKRVTGPAKPPRLKAAKKQLQFESPLPRRTRAMQQQQNNDHPPQQEKQEHQQEQRQEAADKVIAMPGSSQDADTDAAAEAAVDVPETDPDPAQLTVTQSQSSSSAARRRLAEGCTSLMYACQRGDIVQVLAQMREKVTMSRQKA